MCKRARAVVPARRNHHPIRQRLLERKFVPDFRRRRDDRVISEMVACVARLHRLGRKIRGIMLDAVMDGGAVALLNAALRVVGVKLLRPPHIDPADARESGFANHPLADCKGTAQALARLKFLALRRRLGDEIAVDVPGIPDADRRHTVDRVVLGRLEIVVDPVFRHGDLVFGRMCARLVVVCVHHVPL